MDEFQSEKEQIEEIKHWWKQNGSFIVTGLVLGVAVLGGWKYWTQYKEQKAAAASAYYEELTQAVARDDSNSASDLISQIKSEFADTPYASQAALAMAKVHVQSDEPALAAEQLQYALDNTKDKYLKLVARHRLARLLLSQDRADEALAIIDVADPGNFAARFHEVRGDIYSTLGRIDEARAEYRSALDSFEPGLIDENIVEMKLNDLTVSAGAASETVSDSDPAVTPESSADIVPEPETEPGA